MEIQQMMALSLQNQLQEAQINKLKAETTGQEIQNKNESEGGINQDVKKANINNLIANTENTEAKMALTNAQKTAQGLQNGIIGETMEATIGKAMNEFKIGINALYRSEQETEWLKNNLQQAEENYKNTLAKLVRCGCLFLVLYR